jgi:ribosomal protein L3
LSIDIPMCTATELHKKETCEAVTLIETPPMIVVGLVGYIKRSHAVLPHFWVTRPA